MGCLPEEGAGVTTMEDRLGVVAAAAAVAGAVVAVDVAAALPLDDERA